MHRPGSLMASSAASTLVVNGQPGTAFARSCRVGHSPVFWIIGVGAVECLDVAQRNPRTGDCGGEAVRRPRGAWDSDARGATTRCLVVQEARAVACQEVLAGHARARA